MTGEYISRAALLLQYYSALGELMEEERIAASKATPAPQRGEHLPEPYRVARGAAQAATP